MKSTTARRQIMIFAMGAMALITLATTLIVGAHYWEMLSGIFLIALVGLTLPDWAAWWATYWHAKATSGGNEDTRVSNTCLVVSFSMSLVMVFNAGAVLATWWDDKKAVEFAAQSSKAATDLETVKTTGTTEAIKTRGQVIQQMKASGVSDRTIREYLKSEASRDNTKTLTEPNAKAEKPSFYVSEVPESVRKYMAFYVYIVPFIVGLLGVFAIIVSVQLPGGVEFGKNGNEFPSVIEMPGK